jgi:probable rRNA maturation factor
MSDVNIVVSDEQADIDVDADRWARLAEAVLRDEQRVGELTLTFVDRDEIAALNAEHMGEDGPTDVLSFPLDAELGPGDAPFGPVLLGDVVVCPAVAAAQAPTRAGTLDDQLALLVVHGVLHVLGHDHAEPEETVRMRARELELLMMYHWHGAAPAAFDQEQG